MSFEAIMTATANLKAEDMLHDCRPMLVVFKDGRVQRFVGTDIVQPSLDSITGVESKDVVIDDETGTYVRLYNPQNVERVGVLVYYHGGGFVNETAASPLYHNYLNSFSSKANMVVVSVDYRRAPEHPLPAAYEDCWTALRWLSNSPTEPWLTSHADLSRVFLAGDSAGANIVHQMAKRLGKPQVEPIGQGITVKGIVLVHPYFWGTERIGSEQLKVKSKMELANSIWKLACPGSTGLDDPLINPAMDPQVGALGVEKVLVCVAEQDTFRDRGFNYKEVLLKRGWKGNVSVVEILGKGHVFHLFNPVCQEAAELMNQIVDFCNNS